MQKKSEAQLNSVGLWILFVSASLHQFYNVKWTQVKKDLE